MISPFSDQRFRIIFGISWLAWVGLYAVVLYVFDFPKQAIVADSFISNFLLFLICILVTNIYRYYLPGPQYYSYHFALVVLLAVVWFFVSRFFLKLLLRRFSDYENMFSQSAPIRLAVAFLLIGCMILVTVLWYTLQNKQEDDRRKSETIQLAKEAELINLRQQLQPHFLFNSLNSINALIGSQPQQARNMIQQLSDFLRGTLRKDDQQRVTLDEELSHLQLYLDIEKVRFGYRLSTQIEKEEATGAMLLPAMLLQPVLENAIKFGLYNTLQPVTISIYAKAVNGNLQVSVVNPIDPDTTSSKKGTGFGLSSIQRRLYLVFARQNLLQTQIIDDSFITTITIPQPV